MKPAPNYEQTKSVDGKWKQELLIYLGKQFNLKTFVETGTCDGGTLMGVYNYFDNCYSIELSDYYYNISKERFKHIDNVYLFKGNSSIILREILEKLHAWESNFLFWLDAHSSGGLTANEGDPLPEEIKSIMELRPDALVVIDDEPNDNRVKGLVTDEWTTEYRTGITFLYKNGLYQIPEFE